MTWSVTVASTARRDLAQIPEKVYPAITEALLLLEENPQRVGKPLRFDLEGIWSLHRGAFRILYQINDDDQTVRVVGVGHRGKIYRPGGRTQQ